MNYLNQCTDFSFTCGQRERMYQQYNLYRRNDNQPLCDPGYTEVAVSMVNDAYNDAHTSLSLQSLHTYAMAFQLDPQLGIHTCFVEDCTINRLRRVGLFVTLCVPDNEGYELLIEDDNGWNSPGELEVQLNGITGASIGANQFWSPMSIRFGKFATDNDTLETT